jgi:membrane fusion protein (multidrug efflux system)
VGPADVVEDLVVSSPHSLCTWPLLLALASAACGSSPKATAKGPVETASVGGAPGAVVIADTATLVVPLSLQSQLYVERDAAVLARSSGMVEALKADLGVRVGAGQELARLESADQTIALSQARETFENTKQQVERQRALATAGVVTRADSERVEFEHRQAALTLQKAQRDLDLTRIVAPFGGVVTGRTARVQRLVKPGDSLFRVTALEPVLAAVHVPEASAGALRVGADAQVIGGDGGTARARVVRASPIIDAASGTREMVLQLAPGSRLTPGSTVTVRLGAERRRVISIPRSAVAREGYALVWDDSRTVLRPIVLGAELEGDRIEVVSGLAPGERVVRSVP